MSTKFKKGDTVVGNSPSMVLLPNFVCYTRVRFVSEYGNRFRIEEYIVSKKESDVRKIKSIFQMKTQEERREVFDYKRRMERFIVIKESGGYSEGYSIRSGQLLLTERI